jgi:1A family penicillin-binding protein
MSRRAPWPAWALASACVAGAGLAAIGLLSLYAESKLSALVVGGLGESFSTRLYAAPYAWREGSTAAPDRVIARLERLGYQRVPSPGKTGEYSWRSPEMSVWLRGFRSPTAAQEPGLYTALYEGGLLRSEDRAWTMRTSSGAAEPQLLLEPELAAELSGARKVRRDPSASADIPDTLKKAVIAAEDRRFYTHRGLDPRGIARALWRNATGHGALQGGSTITQQLAKNLFLNPRRTLRRKAAEAALSLYMELRYGKERILTLYLNHIYLGQDGPVSIAGVKAAAEFYFGKRLDELSAADCATIAGLIRSPHRYNPFREPAEARRRRDAVLRAMGELGYIADAPLREALASPLATRKTAAPARRHENDYFAAEVVRELLPRYGEEELFRHGLSLYTTLDPLLQRDAQNAVSAAKPQAALVALDPRTGEVLALSGGRDFSESQFNRATQARRQPGSAFKPFVYGAALEKGFTAATVLDDRPRSYPRAERPSWDPRNYEGIYFGTATMRDSLAHSLNSATLDLAERTGIQTVIDFARRLGIDSPLARDLGTALGASEVTLLELTSAYAPFANGGWKIKPRLVTAVADAEGTVLEQSGSGREPALEPAVAYLVTSLLTSVVAQGTAKPLAAWGWSRPTAAKTGTTNDGRDAWLIGYTPEMLTGVWYGDDRQRALKATGAKNALPVWVTFMKSAGRDFSATDFERPPGLSEAVIDPATGLLARSGCPQRRTEVFKIGTEPAEQCPVHIGGIKGFFRRLFKH